MSESPPNHPTTEAHPTVEALQALSLGLLTEVELAPVVAHLGDCPECCRRIDELANDDRLLARLQQRAGSREETLVSAGQRRSAVRALRQAHAARSGTLQAPPATLHVPPRQVGDYDILAEVGRGGMGVVYKARHRSLQRVAALKMVLAGEFASPKQELRFRLEAELAARVRHVNIVQVYEIASYEGRPFLALEWVEGGSLADRLDGTPWPFGETAALIETLARAIDVAHTEGVVHRDLKPANILLAVERAGSVSDGGLTPAHASGSSGIPKITDFGLAQTIEDGKTLTQSGFLVGTPGYMAPEQAGGKRALIGPATDIYALGVMLYQLLTGRLPFECDSTLELLRAVTSDEPTRPRRLQPRVPRDLEAVALHCLEKEPSHRYPSALALAEDLQRFREGKPVVARPVGAVARLVRACRRRPLVALLLALLTVSLFGGLGGVTWKWLEANAHARQEEAEKKAAQYQAYRASVAAATAALENHDSPAAARHLKLAPEALQGWEWRHLRNRLDESSAVFLTPTGEVGFLLASPDRLRVGASTSAGLRLTDLAGGSPEILPIRPARQFHPEAQAPLSNFTAMHTRQGLRVAAWAGNKIIDVFDEIGNLLCRVPCGDDALVGQIAVSPDGTRVACDALDGKWARVRIFDAASGKLTAVCDGHFNATWAFTFSPDGTHLASCGEDKTARVWDAESGALLATCRGHASKVRSVTFSHDGTRLVTTSTDGTVRQWDARTGEELEPAYDRHSGEVTGATYSPDGQWVASVGDDRTIRVWRARGREDMAILHGHTGRVIQLAFDPEGRRLASLSNPWPSFAADDTVRVWDVDPKATLPVLRGHTSYVYPVAFSPDGRWLASGSWDCTVRLWDAATGEPCATLPHQSFVLDLAFGPDGTWLMTGSYEDGRLKIWDVATARVRKEIRLPDGLTFRSLTVSPDGTRVAVTAEKPRSTKRQLIVYDIASRKSLHMTEGSALAYSPDGRWLAALAADDKAVLLLDAHSHETIARFSGHEKLVDRAAFSPDSRRLASCSRDHTVRLWQIDPLALPFPPGEGGDGTVRECQVLSGHTDEVFALAFHPEGTRLVTGGRDGAVWLWDLARDKEVVRLPGHKSYVWSLAFSKDGSTLASGSGDTTIRLWDTAPLKTRYDARREAAVLRPQAEKLVEKLWREKNDPADVVAALRADQQLSEALRHAALRAVLRRVAPPEAAPGNAHDPP